MLIACSFATSQFSPLLLASGRPPAEAGPKAVMAKLINELESSKVNMLELLYIPPYILQQIGITPGQLKKD